MRELSINECTIIHGGDVDDYFGDIFTMIQNHESKLILVGTAASFVTGFFGAKVGLTHYGLVGMFSGGIGGVVAGIYLLPLSSLIIYRLVEQSYNFLGIVRE